MSHKSSNPAVQTFKMLFLTTVKLLAIAIAFALRITATVLARISELLEKATGHGSGH